MRKTRQGLGSTASPEQLPAAPACPDLTGRELTASEHASGIQITGYPHHDDETRVAVIHALARCLADEITAFVADARAGRVEAPLTIHSALLASFALEALTQPVDDNETATRRLARQRQIAHGLGRAADLINHLTRDPSRRGSPPCAGTHSPLSRGPFT